MLFYIHCHVGCNRPCYTMDEDGGSDDSAVVYVGSNLPDSITKANILACLDDHDLCTVILKGVPTSVDSLRFRTICEAHGKVTSLRINMGKGTAFVTYSSPELASAASIKLNGLTLGGGIPTVVSPASKKPQHPDHTATSEHSDLGYKTPHKPPVYTHQGAPTSQGLDSPQQSYELITDQGHGAPPFGYGQGPPQLGYEIPTQGYGFQGNVPLWQGYGSPPQSYEPFLHGRGPLPRGHVLPQEHHFSTYAYGQLPPPQGCGLPFLGHGPPPPGRGPQGWGLPPPNYRPPPPSHGLKPRKFRPPPHIHGQGSMELQIYGPPSQGQRPHPQGHCAPVQSRSQGPMQRAHNESGVVTVKVNNLHVNVTNEELKGSVSFISSAVVSIHHTPRNKPNYAHINCADQADACKVVESLNEKRFYGMPVSAKIQKGYESSMHPPPMVADGNVLVDMQVSVPVKVSKLPQAVTQKQIYKHLSEVQGIISVVLQPVPNQEHKYAYVNCQSGIVAQQVVQILDGIKLSGSMIKAAIQQPKKYKESGKPTPSEMDTAEEGQEMSQDLYDFFRHRFRHDIATFEARGGALLYSEGFLTLRGPETEVSAFYQNTMMLVKDGSQCLTTTQWRQLTASKKRGPCLFQELASSFLHNPDVSIFRRENPFNLVIIGFQAEVDAARIHFLSKLDGKLAVDR